jgi:addiction module HigA family antidote
VIIDWACKKFATINACPVLFSVLFFMRTITPITPGELLKQDFLDPMGISQYRLAKEIGVPAQRIGEIVAGKRSITADTDLRLCKFFGLSNGYWLRAQVAYDTEQAAERLSDVLNSIKPWNNTNSHSGQGI